MRTQSTTFATLEIAPLLDHLCAAVDSARTAAADSPTWLRAIDKAWDHLLTVETIAYCHSDHAIRVESATEPGRFYTANGACGCEAFTRGKGVCWHRACARLVRRALELLGDDAQTAEREALAAELTAEALAAGCCWYEHQRDGITGAAMRLPELERYAAEWDRDAGAMQAQALGARIGAAQAEAMQAEAMQAVAA